MVLVKLRENIRWFDNDDSEFNILSGQTKELPEKSMRSYALKDMLFRGQLIMVEGEMLFNLKEGKILLSGSHPGTLYGYEYGEYFIKDLSNETITWLEIDKVPEIIKKKMQGEFPLNDHVGKESVSEESKVDDFDINKDGVVDKKDLSLASKVLNSKRKKK
jgi:hypothetical protein